MSTITKASEGWILNVQNANNVLKEKHVIKNCNFNSLQLCKFLSCRMSKKTGSDRNCNKGGLKWPHLSHGSPTAPYCNLLLTASLQKLKINISIFLTCALSWTLSYQAPGRTCPTGSQLLQKGWAAIWGKLGTVLQAYALNPCTKFPPNPTSRKVNT